MAPILATSVGIMPPVIDDERLKQLMKDLHDDDNLDDSGFIDALPIEWIFEEQVDLHFWIKPLNRIDRILREHLEQFPQLLLAPPVERKRGEKRDWNLPKSEDDLKVPDDVLSQILKLLQFLEPLLRNSSSKAVFYSVDEVVDLLACWDDNVADAALQVLYALSLPPAIHKQQAPEVSQHSSALHTSKNNTHARLVQLAKGYGTKGMGLGLATIVTADDSIHGQGALPQDPGTLYFSYHHENNVAELSLEKTDILETDTKGKKRRKVDARKIARTTAELYLLALDRAGQSVPHERLFALLSEIRLARCFHNRIDRVRAVNRRLFALIAILHTHSSQEVMSGYFQAQPELCVELVDLLRPTVSVASVSKVQGGSNQDLVAALAEPSSIPYDTRTLAIEAVTALINRRDASTGPLAGSVRLSSVLSEIGVVKGQYLGLLPTLIRYSLSFFASPDTSAPAPVERRSEDMDVDLGLAFLQATQGPTLPRLEQVLKALDFADAILTLTSAVISAPTGTSSLTESGLIPALLSTVTVDTEVVLNRILPDLGTLSKNEQQLVKSKMMFVTTQAVQILEGSIVTHGNALTAFRDLNGISVMVKRLSAEMEKTRRPQGDDSMTDESDTSSFIRSSNRVMLFGLTNCLTIMFHQESSTSVATLSGGAQLRTEELTRVAKLVFDEVDVYDGHLAASMATLLSDVMNSEPQIVHYVHESGIADSFLRILDRTTLVDGTSESRVPPVAELIISITNVIAALSLTEAGANKIIAHNPYPKILELFLSPKYAMPRSRCLLQELTAVVGTSFDEIMRHTESHKPIILDAIVRSIKEVVRMGKDLVGEEFRLFDEGESNGNIMEMATRRTCLIQYTLNFGQILEQVLHNEDHCGPFVEAGGLEVLLDLYEATLPGDYQYLTHLSGLSSPSVSTLHHSTIEETIALATRSIFYHHDSSKVLRLVLSKTRACFDAFRDVSGQIGQDSEKLLSVFPTEPLHFLNDSDKKSLTLASKYLRHLAILQWSTTLLASCLKSVNQRSRESSHTWNTDEKRWKLILLEDEAITLFRELSHTHQFLIKVACWARSSDQYEEREKERLEKRDRRTKYTIRIVCPEGAVVRDGIEIDRCASVGNMDMGEIDEAYDRCVNSSGILRYKTSRGWVSEMTRGHGREPIAEVLALSRIDSTNREDEDETPNKDRKESCISDLQTVAISVMARVQTCYSDLFASLAKLPLNDLRDLSSLTSISFDGGSQADYVSKIVGIVIDDARRGLQGVGLSPSGTIDRAGALYAAHLVRHYSLCIFDEKPHRGLICFPLLIHLLEKEEDGEISVFFRMVRQLFCHCLDQFSGGIERVYQDGDQLLKIPRSVASALPPCVALLRKLVTTAFSSTSMASILSRIKISVVEPLFGVDPVCITVNSGQKDGFFQPEALGRSLLLEVSESVACFWTDPNLNRVPAHLIYPFTAFVGEVIVALDNEDKKKSPSSDRARGMLLSDWVQRRRREESESDSFEPDESVIAQLADMGFDRNQAENAIESTRSNRLEVVMEYALTHPTPDEALLTRRREERESRRNREATSESSSIQENVETSKSEPKDSSDSELRFGKCLDFWLSNSPKVCVSAMARSGASINSDQSGIGDGQGEAFTVVLTGFLLDVCQKYPERLEETATCLFTVLRTTSIEQLERNSTESQFGLASLCHASVLLLKAFPSSRKVLLRCNALSGLVSCMDSPSTQNNVDRSVWLAPCLLVFEVMAQPSACFELSEFSDLEPTRPNAFSNELEEIKFDHYSKARDISELARKMVVFIVGGKDTKDDDGVKEADNLIPSYFPLLTDSMIESTLNTCCKIIELGASLSTEVPPGLLQAALMLLLRLLSSPSLSEQGLKRGLCESILSLPGKCTFTGHSGIVALIFRRLMEDEATLQSAMEAELRSILSKLAKNSVDSQIKSIPLASFLEAVTPLICRDSLTFMKAMLLTTNIDAKTKRVTLALKDEHVVRSRQLEIFLRNVVIDKNGAEEPKERSQGHRRKSKSPGRVRRMSSSKKKKSDLKITPQHLPSPAANHISSLLQASIIRSSSEELACCTRDEIEDHEQFLWLGDLLEILADLVLAVPACASAVHNYRPHKSKNLATKEAARLSNQHALRDCPSPPQSFVTFLLHYILSQDRWSLRNDPLIWERRRDGLIPADDVATARRKIAFRVSKITQNAARVLVALVIRPGEGRKRVISDLLFALSGGKLGHGSTEVAPESASESIRDLSAELNALQAWGDICLGLMSSKFSGRSIESTSALNFDTVRVMLDGGMAHALLYAMHRVDLVHPMASAALESLLSPLEVLSRPSVYSEIQKIVEKSLAKGSEQHDKDHETVDAHDSTLLNAEADAGFNSMLVDENASGDEEMIEGDEEVTSDEEDDIDGSASESDESASAMEDENTEDSGSSSDSSSMSDEIEEDAWEVDYDEPVMEVADREDDGFDEEEENFTERGDALREDWTRIESSGFGGIFMGSAPREPRAANLNQLRSQGFMDAAEHVIGSLIRSGEISNEAIAELENSLGIRLGGGRSASGMNGQRLNSNANQASNAGNRTPNGDAGTGEIIGTLPHINQRNQPDLGYAPFGNGGNAVEPSALEYVFGGPAVTSGNRNYDLDFRTRDHEDANSEGNIGQLDLQLFPAGSSSVAIPRAQSSLHPLFCGVDLPPINSLVADYLSHSVRSSRRGQLVSRRPGDWASPNFQQGGYLVATANGNIIRSTRSHGNAALVSSLPARSLRGPIGWSDDGQALDANVQSFRSAVESIFQNFGQRSGQDEDQGTRPQEQEPRPESEPSQPVQESFEAAVEAAVEEAEEHQEDTTMVDAGNSPSTEATRMSSQQEHESRSPSDGEQVASSLAEGLVLSNQDEGTVDANHETDADGPGNPESEAATGENAVSGPEPAGDSMEPPQNQVTSSSGLICPPDVDPEVFASLPEDMQRDCIAQYTSQQEIAAQIEGSDLDPAVLAELPEDMRREIIEQDRRDRERSQSIAEAPADPSHAEEMDSASFIASLAPELREEILLTADEAFLNSLPPNVRAEAQIIRERASSQHRSLQIDAAVDEMAGGNQERDAVRHRGASTANERTRRKRAGKVRVEVDREAIIYTSGEFEEPFAANDLKMLVRFFFLLSQLRPPKLFQRFIQNLVLKDVLRDTLSKAMVQLLGEDGKAASDTIEAFKGRYSDSWRLAVDSMCAQEDPFPPSSLLGVPPEIPGSDFFHVNLSTALLRRKLGSGATAAMAATLPRSTSIASSSFSLPPVVLARILDTLHHLCKNSNAFAVHLLSDSVGSNDTYFDALLDLLEKPIYLQSSSNLEQLLGLLEVVVSPLSYLPRLGEDDAELSKKELESLDGTGKQWVDVPRPTISQHRLQLLCSILRAESCRESSFSKVNTIVRRLCRIDQNRGFVLGELGTVAHGLGSDAVKDLKALRMKLEQVALNRSSEDEGTPKNRQSTTGSITFSTSTSELKLLRVLQTLHALCADGVEDSSSKKNDGIFVTEELVELLRQMEFNELWDELATCLKLVQILEGVKPTDEREAEEEPNEDEIETGDDEESVDEDGQKKKKLRNSAAGLLSRFLPAIEAFCVATASAVRSREMEEDDEHQAADQTDLDSLVDGRRFVEFVSKNRILINAVVRNNSNLLDKGLRALVQVQQCRPFLDFDVKRQWFKSQMRRLRQHASRRYGNIRLLISRDTVFQDAYNQLRPRNADEMRGRLHITFHNEEGVDAGGLTREFFGILAKEIFNPNYALFTSTEDGTTFQPNPNSSINPDHLSFFRFVGRIVGKAVADGYLLDAHFTRSLYKHMLGIKPTHHDMEAIDPDYYRNLKTILEYNLEDIGLELTFSIDDHSFGRSRVIDLIPNGRKVPVTEENKENYVQLVCQHRMTTAIKSQINAYLSGFYELVSPELISVFTPKELELVISGLPDIDVADLKKNTDYVGWKATDKEIQWFWNCVFNLNRNQKAAFLQFVTGSSKVPLAGFSELQGMRGVQKFSIHKASGTKGALMSAHTCFNSLDLPKYESEEEMKEKLLYAITEGVGSFLFA